MTRIDFYLLEKQPAAKIYSFAARLLEKIHKRQQPGFAAMNSMEECRQFNEFLWTYSDISFIPHCLAGDEAARMTPIVLGLADELPEQTLKQRLYLNFCYDIPIAMTKLERIIEIVPDEPAWRNMARQKYLHYKKANAEIITHKIEPPL